MIPPTRAPRSRSAWRAPVAELDARWLLELDLLALRRRLSDQAVASMWRILVETWQQLPAADRLALRWHFDVTDIPGRGAFVGLPEDGVSLVIYLGTTIPTAELPAVFAHELAHIRLGHLDSELAHPRQRLFAGEVSPATWAALKVQGWQEREFTAEEFSREAAAWTQVQAWGFAVPGAPG